MMERRSEGTGWEKKAEEGEDAREAYNNWKSKKNRPENVKKRGK